ncbi:MAG: DUF3606 domain-containing protein [Caldimonas sp.]
MPSTCSSSPSSRACTSPRAWSWTCRTARPHCARPGEAYDGLRSDHRRTPMSDYATATGHDITIVETTDQNEVRYWCDSLGCTEAQLREAVVAVGTSPATVRAFLKTLSARGVF